MRKALWIILTVALAAIVTPCARADSVTFVTPSGSTSGGQPVDASATFTMGSGVVTIILTDLQTNPTSVGQLISDLDFVLSSGATGTLASSWGRKSPLSQMARSFWALAWPLGGPLTPTSLQASNWTSSEPLQAPRT